MSRSTPFSTSERRSQASRRWPLAWLLAAFAFGATPLALAQINARARAQELIERLSATAASAPDLEAPLNKARALLQRAEAEETPPSARRAFEAAAQEWAEAAHDWSRVVISERNAGEREAELAKRRSELEHARALLEETQARRQRAEGLLRSMEPAQPSSTAQPSTAQPPAPGGKQ